MNEHTSPPLSTDTSARKALGQHFLFDPSILNRIALSAGPVKGRTVIEVGPGPGGLTRAILDAGAEQLIAIEADPRFSEILMTWPEANEGRLIVVEGDARKIDIPKRLIDEASVLPAMIIANLPYNVGTPLLIDWLKATAWRGEMALMFQKEVALRICARAGDAKYGRLSVLAQAVTDPHIEFTLSPGAFKPPPKVDSAIAVFFPLKEEDRFDDLEKMEKVTAAAFGQRRKMLRRSLKGLAAASGRSVEEWLEQASIEPTARAETIDQAGWRRLVRSL